MTESLIDDAFNWFVLILSLLMGVLLGFPEVLSVRIEFARVLIPPKLILIIIWLWSYLAEKTEYRVILKSSAWFLAFYIFNFYSLAFIYIAYPQIAANIGGVIGLLIMLTTMFMPFIIYIVAVRPKYRCIFEDSKIIKSIPLQGLIYIFVIIGIILFQTIPNELSILLFGS